jgi:hypothetical protein
MVSLMHSTANVSEGALCRSFLNGISTHFVLLFVGCMEKSAMAYVDKDLLWADIVKNGNCHVTSGGSLPY